MIVLSSNFHVLTQVIVVYNINNASNFTFILVFVWIDRKSFDYMNNEEKSLSAGESNHLLLVAVAARRRDQISIL